MSGFQMTRRVGCLFSSAVFVTSSILPVESERRALVVSIRISALSSRSITLNSWLQSRLYWSANG